MPVSIELFSGSGIVSNQLKKAGYFTMTIDINENFHPSLCIDILDLKREMLPSLVDFIWASPVCTSFSRAADQSHWQKITISYRVYQYVPLTPEASLSLAMVQKVIQILNWYPNAKFVIENPIGRIQHTAALKNLGHYRYAVNYADFGFKYSKETYLFTNFLLPFSSLKVHSDYPGMRSVRSAYERSKVPGQLIDKIIDYL
jgi:site-specific DNA-cytosine methylase